MDTLFQDLRYALRTLRKSASVTLLAVLSARDHHSDPRSRRPITLIGLVAGVDPLVALKSE